MSTHPLVTVCVLCYNQQTYVEHCLNSIKNDTYPNKKIIVIDDGSTDRSVQVIKDWQINNPEIIFKLITRENKGITATLNDLIDQVAGDYICFIASDDMLYENGIFNRMEILLQHPDKYAVIGDAVVIDGDNTVLFNSAIEDLWHGNKSNYETNEKLKYSVVNQWSVPGPVLLVKKDIYGIIGKYPEDLFAEDLNFYLRVIGLNMLVFLNKPVAYYRVHGHNTCGNTKYSKEICYTFVKSYLNNIKYYHGALRLKIIKKMLVRLGLYIYYSLKK